MRWITRSKWFPPLVALLVSGSVFSMVHWARGAGWLQNLELLVYDAALSHQRRDPRLADSIVTIIVSEADIQELKHYPLTDGELAAALGEKLLPLQPRAIGIDLFRDIPVPPGSEQLDEVLTKHENIIAMMKFGRGGVEIRAPRSLRETDRIGFCDHVCDTDGRVRRGLLYLDDGQQTYPSLALQLALLYLRAEGIEPQPDPVHPEHLRLGQVSIRPFEPNDGGYVGADARGYQLLLDYRGPRRFRTFSFGDVLGGKILPEEIRGKIVLIGTASEGVKDFMDTPIDHKLPGVALHGIVVDQLLRSALFQTRPVKVYSQRQEAAWTFLWSLLGAGLGLGLRSFWRFTAAAASGLLLLGLVAFLCLRFNQWAPAVPPAMAFIASAGLVTSYMAHHEKRDRALLMQLFSRHVSADVARTIWEQRDQILENGRLRARCVTATILFTDMEGFTTISESQDPAHLIEWLNDSMQAMSDLVEQNQGMINKYIGDAIMAVFGVPVPSATTEQVRRDACNAVRCAMAMRRTLSALNRRWQSQGRAAIRMRIGIHTGEVVAGSVGSRNRLEYTVLGDVVNTASRLESFRKELMDADVAEDGCRILIGQRTFELVQDEFRTRPVEMTGLKGKSETIAVHAVVG